MGIVDRPEIAEHYEAKINRDEMMKVAKSINGVTVAIIKLNSAILNTTRAIERNQDLPLENDTHNIVKS